MDHNTLLMINTIMVFIILLILIITGYLAYPIYVDYLNIMQRIENRQSSRIGNIFKALYARN